MRLSFYLKFLFAALFLSSALADVPVIDDPLLEGTEPTVRPVVPTGKVLLLPVSAYDAVAGQLNITATSDNPKVMVRVKTGNPLMKFDLKQEANGADPMADGYDAGFTETIVFQLFRDLAPETVGYIGGFAQGGFYDTNHQTDPTTPDLATNTIFRLADFGEVDGQDHHSFIFQGGSNTGDVTGDVGFRFDNEFSVAANFTGSGQLAMANGGYDGLKRGTNGSQFFVTDGNTRQLDFKHTIFAQLTHGFGVLRRMRTTPSNDLLDDSTPPQKIGTTPKVPIKILHSSTVAQYDDGAGKIYTDAVLVLSATAPGTAHLKIVAKNAQGESSMRMVTVTAQDDTRESNSRPFLTPLPDGVVRAGGQANLGLHVIDLERDYVPETQVLASNGNSSSPNGFSALLGGQTAIFGIRTTVLAYQNQGILGLIGNPTVFNSSNLTIGPYTGPLFPTATATQYEMDGTFRGLDNSAGSTISVGESDLITEPTQITGAPGVAPAAPFVVGRYRDTDAHGKAADITAKINWGDGTLFVVTPATTTAAAVVSMQEAGTVSPDATKPGSTNYQIAGTHTYARPGTYDVVTTITSAGGLRRFIRSTAVISDSTLKAFGEIHVLAGPTVANRVMATFTDGGSTTPASGYVAMIDWGDGMVVKGTVKAAGPGRFSVLGKHSYHNAERFSVSVRIHKSGSASDQDAVAWSTVALTKFFGTQHLPPFNMAHLVAGVTGVPVDLTVAGSALKATKTTETILPAVPAGGTPNSQTYFNYSLQIVNTGNKPSKPAKLRFYLSLDKTVNLTASGSNPADIPLIIKGLKTNEFFLPGMRPGQAIQYFFQKSKYADYRLVPPKNETGTGYNFLAKLDYSDPIADHLPIDKVTIDGKINGIIVDKPFLTTRESGTTDTFSLKLDRAPSANVTLPLKIENDSSIDGTKEGTLDKTSVVFTPADWNRPHPVTVTGVRDTNPTGTTTVRDNSRIYAISLGGTVGADSTDPFYKGMFGPSVLVSNADRDGNLVLTSTSTSISTNESPTSATNMRTVSLTINRLPKAPVSITIAASSNTEGEILVAGGSDDPLDPNKKIMTIDVPPAGMTVPFTRSFTIKGKDDHTRDGNKTYTVSFTVASNDPEFDGLRISSLAVTNVDDGDTTADTTTP